MEDPLSSEAMYEKHIETVRQQHQLVKERKRKKKKKEDEIIFHKGKFVVAFEWKDGQDTLKSL